jgi:hypothetical protein
MNQDAEVQRIGEEIMPTQAQLENWSTYHQPEKADLPKFEAIRAAGLNLAEVIEANTPPCADQAAAIRKVRESVMVANAAIACRGE